MASITERKVSKPRGRKPKNDPKNLVGNRLREMRRTAGLSQEALGAQGIISAPGYIKIENGQRSPSEKLIGKLVDFLDKDRLLTKGDDPKKLKEELLLLKYAGSPQPFVRQMARAAAQQANVRIAA